MKTKVCLFFIFISVNCLAWNPVDSLRNLINSGRSDSLKIAVFVKYSFNYAGEPETVLGLISEIVNYNEKIANEKTRAFALRKIGIVYGKQGYFDKALEYTLRSATLFEKIKDYEGLAHCYNNIGGSYSNKGSLTNDPLYYSRSIEYHLKCIRLRNEMGDTASQIQNSYNNIADVYLAKGDYKKALEYFNKAYVIYAKTAKGLQGLELITLNLGTVYLKMGLKEKKAEYYKKSLSFFQSLINHYKKETPGPSEYYAGALTNMGRVYFEIGKVNEGIDFLLHGFNMSVELKNKRQILEAAEQLVASFEKKSDFKQADEYLHIYNSIKDSLLNEKNKSSVEQMQALYQSSQKDRRIEKLNTDKEIQDAKLYRQNVIIFSVIGGILVILILGFVLLSRYNLKKKANLQLTDAYGKIETKNRQITDSINYSKRIQNAILPSTEVIKGHLKKFFLFYSPKDIVSGDFYWFSHHEDKVFFIAADCTGHGVPGALMSMIGNTLLNEIINQKNISDPGTILHHLNNGVMNALHQRGNELLTQDDGMDISICCIDKKEKNILKYAAANHSIFVKSQNKIVELKGDIYSIGGGMAQTNKQFTSNEYKVEGECIVVMSTDGFYDKFGGEHDRKFLVTQFEEWILKTDFEKEDPSAGLNSTFVKWKGSRKQTDDILVAGFRI
jgi:serine phosphatase RsbU (regulator of sigma subunit)